MQAKLLHHVNRSSRVIHSQRRVQEVLASHAQAAKFSSPKNYNLKDRLCQPSTHSSSKDGDGSIDIYFNAYRGGVGGSALGLRASPWGWQAILTL